MAQVLRSLARRLPPPARRRAVGLRDRLRAVAAASQGASAAGPRPRGFARDLTEPDGQCLVCGSREVRGRRVSFFRNDDLSCDTRRCRDCGFVSIPRGESKYRAMTAIHELPSPGDRGGGEDRPGREFAMAKMAATILGRGDLDVLVYGAGRSMDNVHIGRLPNVRLAAVGDIMKVRADPDFVDISRPATRKYDVVVASEVIEHFRSPRADFAHLFDYVRDDGLLVCGTTLNAGGPLERHRYIFYPDHTAYYSPRSLSLVADAFGWFLDFRAVRQGPKRYVFFTRSPDVARQTTCYFGRRVFAPSEGSVS